MVRPPSCPSRRDGAGYLQAYRGLYAFPHSYSMLISLSEQRARCESRRTESSSTEKSKMPCSQAPKCSRTHANRGCFCLFCFTGEHQSLGCRTVITPRERKPATTDRFRDRAAVRARIGSCCSKRCAISTCYGAQCVCSDPSRKSSGRACRLYSAITT